MTVEVLFFGSLANTLGVRAHTLELSDNACVSDALSAIAENYPAIKTHVPALAIAVNYEYVSPDHGLDNGDELALIPPVSGG